MTEPANANYNAGKKSLRTILAYFDVPKTDTQNAAWVPPLIDHNGALGSKEQYTDDDPKGRPASLSATLRSYSLPHKTVNNEEISWQFRRQKRIEAIDCLKKTWWYRAASARSPESLRAPPEPGDRLTSKRQWEKQILDWKVSLRTVATREQIEPSAG